MYYLLEDWKKKVYFVSNPSQDGGPPVLQPWSREKRCKAYVDNVTDTRIIGSARLRRSLLRD